MVNGGTTTNYFKLEKVTRQGDPISAYLFILVLEIVFLFTKESKKINGLNIFDKTFLYTAYADDTTFFLKDTKSVIELMNIFDTFFNFSGLKPNKSKCEIAGIAQKLHMMHSHLDFFKSSMGNYSEEHGECFHQDVMEFEKGYQGECNERMMGDYVWGLVRETQTLHQRKSRKFVYFQSIV